MIEDSSQIDDDINFLNSLLKKRELDELKNKSDLFINKYPEHYVGFFFVAVYYFYNNKFIKAEKYLNKSIDKNQNIPSVLNLMGLVKKNLGKLNDAVIYYKNALHHDLNDISIYINLSSAFIALENYKESLNVINKAKKIDENDQLLKINEVSTLIGLKKFNDAKILANKIFLKIKDNPVLLNSIGSIYSHEKNYKLALEFFNKSFTINSNDLSVFLNITSTLSKLDRDDEAIKIYKTYILNGGMNPDIYNKLTSLMLKVDKLDECYNFFSDISKKNSINSMAYNQLGNVLRLQNKNEESLISYKKAIELSNKAQYFNNIGAAYQELNQFKKSESYFNKALDLSKAEDKKSIPACYHNLGNLYTYTKKFELANENYRKAIEIEPYFVDSFRSLVRNKDLELNDEITRNFVRIYDQDLIGDGDSRATLAFALAELYENANNYKLASNLYIEANKLIRKTFSYSTEEQEKYFRKLKSIYSDSNFKKYSFSGNKSKKPIFIIGLPRSGSTLVEQIISNHSRVHGAGEVDYFQRTTFEAEKILDKKYPFKLSDFDDETINTLGEYYLDKINIDKNIAKVTDKNLANFFSVGLIKMIFPNAKIINVSRHKKDNCLSIFSIKFTGSYPYAYDLKEISEYYTLYQDLMDHWNSIYPGEIYNINYEDVISNIEKETKNILNYCDLTYEENCLEFYNNKRPVMTASTHQVRKKLYNSSVGRWKNFEEYLEF
tara:strand:+ start:3415 stop:5580 length:2166 start_codon:yes stop_codon:yes gene_type:complete